MLTDARSELHLETEDQQSVPIEGGEHLITLFIDDFAGQRWLRLAVDGLPQLGAPLPWYAAGDRLEVVAGVNPRSRSVWEQNERPLLLHVTADSDAGQQQFQLWIAADRSAVTRQP